DGATRRSSYRSLARQMSAVDNPGESTKRPWKGSFWPSFWPSFASTVAGILVGVPIALGLSHYGLSIQEGARQADERARLQRGLKSLTVAVRQNSERLRQLSDQLRGGQVPFDVALDVSAWDVSKQEILPFLQDAEMQRRIAHHFTRAESVRRLAALLLQQSGRVASALGGSTQTRKALSSHLQSESDELSREAQQLADDIARVAGR